MSAVIAIAHKLLVCRPLRIRDFWVGGVIGAVVITALLTVAVTVLPALVARAGPVYGSFATVVGVFAVLYLLSQTLVLSVEISTVLEARLSPRGLTDARLKARRAESRERRRVADDAAVIERRANGKTKIVQKARDPDPRRRGAEIEQDAKAASAGQA